LIFDLEPPVRNGSRAPGFTPVKAHQPTLHGTVVIVQTNHDSQPYPMCFFYFYI